MGSSGGVQTGVSLSWTTLLAVVVIGAFSMLSLFLGFQAYGSDRSEQAGYYIIIGATGFAAMGYMLFRTRSYTPTRLGLQRAEVFTTLECPKCGLKKIKDFERGEYVFKDDIPCTRCDGKMVVTRIHRRKKGEKEKEKPTI